MDAKLINWENSLIERFYACSMDLYPTYYLELDGYSKDAPLFHWIRELHGIVDIHLVIVGTFYHTTNEYDTLNYDCEDCHYFDPKYYIDDDSDRLKILITFPDTEYHTGSGPAVSNHRYIFGGISHIENREQINYRRFMCELAEHVSAVFVRKQKYQQKTIYEFLEEIDAVRKMEIDPESYVDDDDD